MAERHLFYRYYDTLFTSKDYQGEIDAVLRYCAESRLLPCREILEVGCGTGNHTLKLAEVPSSHVTAVDIDPEMLSLAREKADAAGKTTITFSTEIRSADNPDLCVALFNVVNYIGNEVALRKFFSDIADVLRPGGLFVFDCWNGTAALADPPGSKSYDRVCADGRRINCRLDSRTDIRNRVTTLNYRIDLYDRCGRNVESGVYEFEHRLWTPEEIRTAVEENGFRVETTCVPFRFDQKASGLEWKIMFACGRR